MGDNRDHSSEAVWGFFDREAILGRPFRNLLVRDANKQ